MMISQRIKLILGLLFCCALSVSVFVLLDRTLCFDGAVVAKYDGGVEVVITDVRRGLKDSLFGGFYPNTDSRFYGGEKVWIEETYVSDGLYEKIDLGDEVRVYYLFESHPNPYGMVTLTNVFFMNEKKKKHLVSAHYYGGDCTPQSVHYEKWYRTDRMIPSIRSFVEEYHEKDSVEEGYVFVNTDIDGTYYLLNRYKVAAGERYLSLVTETVEGDEIIRTGDVYAFIEIREINGKETIVLSDEFDENQRYISLE